MPVEVVVARSDTVVDAILATGQIEALQSIELRPDIEGRVAGILVREGAPVSRGQALIKVDDAELKAEVAAATHPVPVGVTTGTVRWTDERRHGVPLTLVCPEFSPAQAQEWIDSGDVPELAGATALELVDIDSGHWPMFTQPTALAALIDRATRR